MEFVRSCWRSKQTTMIQWWTNWKEVVFDKANYVGGER